MTGHERLAVYIKRSPMNQGEIAQVIGIHFTHLSKILSGLRPGLATALKIEAATGIPVSAWGDAAYAKADRKRARLAAKARLGNEISHAANS